jgi:hypothetical protein
MPPTGSTSGGRGPGGPTAYEVRWMQVCSVVVAVGIGLALLWWPLWAVAAQTIVPTALCWMLLMSTPPGAARPFHTPPPWRLILARATLLGSSLPAVRAFADLSLPVTALLVGVAALSSPLLVGWLDRHRPGAAGQHLDPESAAREQAWTLSGQALAAAATEADRLAVVKKRQSMLDAWEELDPAGFAAWLATPPER